MIPKGVTLDEVDRWGFYSDENRYYFRNRKGDGWDSKSNFIMNPLFHVKGSIGSHRMYEVENYKGQTEVVTIPQKDMVSISAFKVHLEDLGDYLWTGAEAELNRLKAWLYAKTKTATEITQLGWRPEGFFCWGNGIFNGEYQQADKYGIVQHKEKFYYIPSASSIYKDKKELYEFERKFVHYESDISMRDYFSKFVNVFGDNGKVAIAFYLSSLFLDIIEKRFNEFPLLNLFGPKGTGKNAMADTLLLLFGHKQKPPNLHNTSKAAIADHVAKSANALCILDEYRNDIEMEKREMLKGFWGKTGRSRMNMDKDKKKEISSVDQALIILGQQMATADIALFQRFLFLSFTQAIYTPDEERAYEELKVISNKGITHITHQVLKNRQYFENNYRKYVDKVSDDFRNRLKKTSVETRTFNNWLTVIAAYATLEEQLELPWSYDAMMDLCVKLMLEQNKQTSNNDDLGKFWKVFQYLISSNYIHEGGDYKVVHATTAIRRYMENGKWFNIDMKWKEPKKLFYMNISRVFVLYRKEDDNPLPADSVEFYLRNCEAFLFETKKESFKKIDPKTGHHEQVVKDNGAIKKKYTSTSALVFDLDKLNLSLNELEAPTPEELTDSEAKLFYDDDKPF